VTLSDEEARRRGTQKTDLERRAPPTFDMLIEIQNRDRFAVHLDVSASVDALLRGYPLPPEIRMRDDAGYHIEKPAVAQRGYQNQQGQKGYRRQAVEPISSPMPDYSEPYSPPAARYPTESVAEAPRSPLQTVRIYPYGVARNRLLQAIKRLRVPALVANDPGQADVLVTLRSYYRKRQRSIVDAENRGTPIYVLRANTINQMQQFLSDLFNLSSFSTEEQHAEDTVHQETQAAIEAVLNGERWVELLPASSSIRRLQHQMARQANLASHSYGKEPYRRVRILRE
jgi:hypothetical protein